MPHSMGHDVPSDWGDKSDDDPVFGLYKRCGMWTHDEAAILYNVGRAPRSRYWQAMDIGCHSGWTTAHIAEAGYAVDAVDPMLTRHDFLERFWENTLSLSPEPRARSRTSRQYFRECVSYAYDLVCIDGDHEPGEPLNDAQNAVNHLAETGIILLHDGTGGPVREAVQWLMQQGFKCRAYFTPHLVFCCWRGDFRPPDHVPDAIVRNCHLDGRYPDFDFRMCV